MQFWTNLAESSAVGLQAEVFAGLLTFDLILTLVHSVQELRGRLWRYFGSIVGVVIPDAVGVALFFVGLTVVLWIVGFLAIASWSPLTRAPVSASTAALAIGLLIGARLSDSWFSHIRLSRAGHRPNPGLSSTPAYILEAVVLTVVFWRGLSMHPISALLGVGAGAAAFAFLLPFLRTIRGVLPSRWRQEPVAAQVGLR